MIPKAFKHDLNVDIRVFGFDVNVNYVYHWPKTQAEDRDPLVVHLEFRSDSKVISSTGYRSHFLFSAFLKTCEFKTIEELATSLGEHLAKENDYKPPQPEQQLSLF